MWYLIVSIPDLCTLTYFSRAKAKVILGMVAGLHLIHLYKANNPECQNECMQHVFMYYLGYSSHLEMLNCMLIESGFLNPHILRNLYLSWQF